MTLCVAEKLPLLASVVCGEIGLSPAGQMVEAEWFSLREVSDGVVLDAYVVMPDHFHGIVMLDTDGLPERPSLAAIIQRLKSRTTMLYTYGVRDSGWPPFQARLWQRNYYEHIIRNERDLCDIRAYIEGNPSAWVTGRHNE